MASILKENWFKKARQGERQAAEQAQLGAEQAVAQATTNVGGQPQAQPQAQPTPQQAQQMTQQKQQTMAKPIGKQPIKQNKPNQTNQANVLGIIQEVAQNSFPYLEQSLQSMADDIVKRSDLNATQDIAKRLSLELMGAWLVAISEGQTSDPASIVAKSDRIISLIGSGQ